MARNVRMRPFSKLTKQHRVALTNHNLQSVLHIQRAYRMARVFSCRLVVFVQVASPVRPLVLK